MNQPIPEYLTIPQVSQMLNIKPMTLYKWAWNGRLPSHKFGRLTRICLPELQAWVEKTKLPERNRR